MMNDEIIEITHLSGVDDQYLFLSVVQAGQAEIGSELSGPPTLSGDDGLDGAQIGNVLVQSQLAVHSDDRVAAVEGEHGAERVRILINIYHEINK